MTQTTHHTGLHEQTKHRLQELGMELPTPSIAVASYVAATRIGNTVYTSGQLPMKTESWPPPAKSAPTSTTHVPPSGSPNCP